MNAGSPAEPLPQLDAMTTRVRALVPDLRGLTLTVVDGAEVTMTMVASSEEVAALDAVQYVDGGPCTEDVHRTEALDVDIAELLEQKKWQLYSHASSAAGVGSMLSLPITSGDRVVGAVNLYAAGSGAFTGLHGQIAQLVGADAELAVTNTDLSYWTAKTAMEAPAKVREGGDINVALGVISASQGVNIPIARQRLRNAAARAGISEAQAAGAIKRPRAN